MTNRVIYTRPDGGVSVVSPAAEVDIATVLAKSIPGNATDVQVVDASSIPTDRTFRNAWRQTAGAFDTDMPAARVIHAEHMARAQEVEISRLKVEERKEHLKSNTTQANAHAATVLALEALALNALAVQIGTAPNPTALKAIWPADLPR